MANAGKPGRSPRALFITLGILVVIVVIVVFTMDREEIVPEVVEPEVVVSEVVEHEEPSEVFVQPGVSAVLGQKAPIFALPDTEGNVHRLEDCIAAGRIVVLEWFNPDCPFVIKHHLSAKTMADLYSSLAGHDASWLAINSGAPGKQGHGLERNRRAIEEYGISYPVLIDETGVVGMAYGAKTTPHMYVINREGVLVYMGAIDDNRSATVLGDVNHVREALDAVLSGTDVAVPETAPYGCSVKYPD